MHYLDKCDLAAIPAKKKARRKVSASAARRFVATEAAKSNTTATAAARTASSPAESSQRRPLRLPATVSSPPLCLENASSVMPWLDVNDNLARLDNVFTGF
ncbi:hypothetical protein PC112_g2735 [Phytophthora cactorum]|nr:hypothetical protein PC112_g2735 [Phytophthora cactorum]